MSDRECYDREQRYLEKQGLSHLKYEWDRYSEYVYYKRKVDQHTSAAIRTIESVCQIMNRHSHIYKKLPILNYKAIEVLEFVKAECDRVINDIRYDMEENNYDVL